MATLGPVWLVFKNHVASTGQHRDWCGQCSGTLLLALVHSYMCWYDNCRKHCILSQPNAKRETAVAETHRFGCTFMFTAIGHSDYVVQAELHFLLYKTKNTVN